MDEKPFWRSKTILFNVLAGILFVARLLGFADFTPDPDWMAFVAVVANIVLRFLTDTAVARSLS